MSNRISPVGANVGLHLDLVATVDEGDIIETRTGRRYLVTSVRLQTRGKHAGRQHVRAVVIDDSSKYSAQYTARVHRIRWYRRHGGSGRAGVVKRP